MAVNDAENELLLTLLGKATQIFTDLSTSLPLLYHKPWFLVPTAFTQAMRRSQPEINIHRVVFKDVSNFLCFERR